jgi:hypothetical protein
MLDIYSGNDEFFNRMISRRPQRHSTAPKDKKTERRLTPRRRGLTMRAYPMVQYKSGKGKFLTSPPHTTGHAGPHPAVH